MFFNVFYYYLYIIKKKNYPTPLSPYSAYPSTYKEYSYYYLLQLRKELSPQRYYRRAISSPSYYYNNYSRE